jgi:transcriptional regulator with XRE-family HTH domain
VAQEGFEASVRRLARTIRARRLELNLSQEHVAFEAGLSPRHYQQLESGRGNPTYRTIFVVAQVLSCTVSKLLDHPAHRVRPQRRRARKKLAQQEG